MDDGIDFDDLARRISSTDDPIDRDKGEAEDAAPVEDIADLTARVLSAEKDAAEADEAPAEATDQDDEVQRSASFDAFTDGDAVDPIDEAHDAFEAGARAAWGDATPEDTPTSDVNNDEPSSSADDEYPDDETPLEAFSDSADDEGATLSGFGAWSAHADDEIVPEVVEDGTDLHDLAANTDEPGIDESADHEFSTDVVPEGDAAPDPLVLTPLMATDEDNAEPEEGDDTAPEAFGSAPEDAGDADLASAETPQEPEHDEVEELTYKAPEVFPVGAAVAPDERRPRVALMGEFSAGKSTLSNLLLGARSLPVNVTATQLPPVWISFGDRAPYRVDLDGNEEPVDLNHLEDVPVEETSHIRIFRRSDILEICDLIDMPGISDPNMSSQVWQRMLPEADAVIWCTHATQAWRQSEAAVWSMLDTALQKKSLLLLTRMDKILTERDQGRVLRRVGKETQGLFRNQFGISLTQALAAGEDQEKWEASGGEAFAVALVELIREIAEDLRDPERRAADAARATSTSLTQRPRAMATMNDAGAVSAESANDLRDDAGSVLPQRVRPKVSSREGKRTGQRPSQSQSLNF